MLIREAVWSEILNVLNKYQYCILRNYAELPYTTNDIDLIIAKSEKKTAQKELISALDKNNVFFIRKTRYACDSLYFFDSFDSNIIHIDFFTSHTLRFLNFATCEEVIARRIKYNDIYIVSPEYEFLDLFFTRLLYTKKIKEKYIPKIVDIYNSNNAVINKLVSRKFSPAIASSVGLSISHKNWCQIENQWSKLVFLLLWHNIVNPKRMFKVFVDIFAFLYRSISKVICPYGLVFYYYNVDSNDKKQLQNYIEKKLLPAFLEMKFVSDTQPISKKHILNYLYAIRNFLAINELHNSTKGVNPPSKYFRCAVLMGQGSKQLSVHIFDRFHPKKVYIIDLNDLDRTLLYPIISNLK